MTGLKDYTCDICGKGFVTKQGLQQHKYTHREANYQCNLCEARFKLAYALKKHVRAVHENEKTHGCPICGTMFQRKGNMVDHCRKVHKNVGVRWGKSKF